VSVTHPRMRPRAVVMDVAIHCAMPPRLAAAVGLDALCQAMESTWAVGSTPESLEYGKLGGALVGACLAESVLTGSPKFREAMMWGAHAAGMAIDISKTTAPHALSYQLTTRFGIPHGIAAALTLGHIGRANGLVTDSNCRDPRGAAWVRARVADAAGALGATPETLPGAVRELLRKLGVPTTLEEAGVDCSSLVEMAREVDPVRLSNNPRMLTVDELAEALASAWPA
ncbi:MAG: alcohol dehydrogenase, partial [Phycisphaerales bacterium]